MRLPKFLTNPVHVMIVPQAVVMMAIYADGRLNFFSSMLLGISKRT